jgi:hypothetical protein
MTHPPPSNEPNRSLRIRATQDDPPPQSAPRTQPHGETRGSDPHHDHDDSTRLRGRRIDLGGRDPGEWGAALDRVDAGRSARDRARDIHLGAVGGRWGEAGVAGVGACKRRVSRLGSVKAAERRGGGKGKKREGKGCDGERETPKARIWQWRGGMRDRAGGMAWPARRRIWPVGLIR